MRTETEMMDVILSVAKKNDLIKVVGMEGSRTDTTIQSDDFQDFDITYIVTDMNPFINDEEWLNVFGKRIMMQKPEDMTLFNQQLGNWYSYLMLFEDKTRIDLTIVPIEELDLYLSSETLIEILLDKENYVGDFPLPTNASYHVKKPAAHTFDDCCNEFWWVSTYVVKGICRREFIYAADYLNQIMRQELLRMISWKVGVETDFSKSVGKFYRFLEKKIDQELWDRVIATYCLESYEEMWESFLACQQLFREVSKEVADELGFVYPGYDEQITKYTSELYEKYAPKKIIE